MGQWNRNNQSNFHFITIPEGRYRESVTEKNEGIIMK